MGLGLFADGNRAGLLVLVASAVVVAGGLFATADRVLPVRLYLALTLFGGFIMSVAIYWGGTPGAAAFSVIYVYLAMFAFIALRRFAVLLVCAGAAMHLTALLLSGHEAAGGVWVVTWGPIVLTGMLAGAAVEFLTQRAERLREADGHRTRFVATVSHELRTPLAAILGSTETLQQHWDRLDRDQRAELIQVIHRHAGRQLRLVNDVLAVTTSRAEGGAPSTDEVHLGEVLQQAAAAMQFPVRVELEEDVVVRADRDHVSQVVENLLVNADRYGAPPVELRARVGDGHGLVEVVDHGSGLDGGLEGGLLEPFTQGDAGDRRSSAGVGLGLTICRDLVASNNGRLEYAETTGGGATFRILLPLA